MLDFDDVVQVEFRTVRAEDYDMVEETRHRVSIVKRDSSELPIHESTRSDEVIRIADILNVEVTCGPTDLVRET